METRMQRKRRAALLYPPAGVLLLRPVLLPAAVPQGAVLPATLRIVLREVPLPAAHRAVHQSAVPAVLLPHPVKRRRAHLPLPQQMQQRSRQQPLQRHSRRQRQQRHSRRQPKAPDSKRRFYKRPWLSFQVWNFYSGFYLYFWRCIILHRRSTKMRFSLWAVSFSMPRENRFLSFYCWE